MNKTPCAGSLCRAALCAATLGLLVACASRAPAPVTDPATAKPDAVEPAPVTTPVKKIAAPCLRLTEGQATEACGAYGPGTAAYLQAIARLIADLKLPGLQSLPQKKEALKWRWPAARLFESGTADLRTDARQDLLRWLAHLHPYSDAQILVGVHASGEGDATQQQAQTAARVKTLQSLFREQGWSARRISVRAYGASMPLATSDSAAGREKNARVEIDLLSK